MKKNPSQDQLNKSLERRLKHLMIQTLERLEDAFPHLEGERSFDIMKGDLRTAFNDAIRAQRDEIQDYEVEYRPLRVNNDNTLSMTRTFLQTVQKIEFTFNNGKPLLKVYASNESLRILEAIRNEFGSGVIYEDNNSVLLEIVGTDACVNSVFPIMDKYVLHEKVRGAYRSWRGEVVKLYRS